MEAKEMHNQEVLVDLEKGDCMLAREDNKVDVNSVAGHARAMKVHGMILYH
jgi:hypothetical protein